MVGKGAYYLNRNEVQTFLGFFLISADPMTDKEGFLEQLKMIDPRYEGGVHIRERFQLEQDSTSWSPDATAIILNAAHALHLFDHETLLRGECDLTIALGGARQSNLDRLRYAVECDSYGIAEIGRLLIAGSTRKLNDAEKENVKNYAPEAVTEADLCHAAATVISKEYQRNIHVSICDNEKAGNREVILRALEDHWPSWEVGNIAIVTTQIYQVSAELDLARIAKEYSNNIELTMAAGNPSDARIIASRTTATYLSEILRTLRAATLAAAEGV